MGEAQHAFQATDPGSLDVRPMAWAARPGSQPSLAAGPAAAEQHAMTSRLAGHWPLSVRALSRWRARRGWVIAVAIAGAVVLVKVTIGFTLVLVLLLS